MLNLTRHFHVFNKGAMLLTTFIAVFLLAGIVTPAFADSPQNTTVTGTIGAGALTETINTAYTFSGTPGTTITYTMPFSISDFTGAAGGWNVTITSTPLTGSAGTLPNNASTITGTTATCTVSGTCSDATLSNAIITSVGVPAASTAPTSVEFFRTASGTGAGTYTVTPTISVVLPGSLLAGSLSSTNTLTDTIGP
jgi:hypothetical protein